MPTQAFPYLVITDGTTTITLADGSGGLTNYAPVQDTWSPVIPTRRHSELGGSGPYAEVAEEITVNIRGTTASDAMANLAALSLLFEQAERWVDEEHVSPVVLQFAPQGSTISSTAAPLQSVILGRASGDETAGVALPVSFNKVGNYYQIDDVKLKFRRRGLWIGASETITSSTGPAGDILTTTFTSSASVPSPVRAGFCATLASGLPNGAMLLLAKSSSKLKVIEAETMASGAWTSVVDTTNNARGGSVLRYTPVATTVTTSGTVASTFSNTYRTAVYAMVRNNSAVTTWTLELTAIPSTGGVSVRTSPVTIDASSQQPRPVFLGILVNTAGALSSYNIRATASAVSGTLDIDYFVFMDLDDETSRAISVFPTVLGSVEIGCDPLVLTGPKAVVGDPNFTAGQPYVAFPPYSGDPFLVNTGTTLSGVILGPGGANWRVVNGSLVSFALRSTRQLAYLTPQ